MQKCFMISNPQGFHVEFSSLPQVKKAHPLDSFIFRCCKMVQGLKGSILPEFKRSHPSLHDILILPILNPALIRYTIRFIRSAALISTGIMQHENTFLFTDVDSERTHTHTSPVRLASGSTELPCVSSFGFNQSFTWAAAEIQTSSRHKIYLLISDWNAHVQIFSECQSRCTSGGQRTSVISAACCWNVFTRGNQIKPYSR